MRRIADSLATTGFRPIADATVRTLVDGAIARRASIDAREHELSIRNAQVSLAKGAYLPKVSLSANFGKPGPIRSGSCG